MGQATQQDATTQAVAVAVAATVAVAAAAQRELVSEGEREREVARLSAIKQTRTHCAFINVITPNGVWLPPHCPAQPI